MKKTRNSFKETIIGITALACSLSPAVARENLNFTFNKGYNDISFIAQENQAVRMINNFDATIENVNASYRSFNQVTSDGYFGIHRLGLGLEAHKQVLQPTMRVVSVDDTVVDKKFGLETQKVSFYDGSNPLLNVISPTYGWAGVYTDGKDHTLQTLTGHSLKPIAESTRLPLEDITLEFATTKNFGETNTPLFWEARAVKNVGTKGYVFTQFDSNKQTSLGAGLRW